MEKLHCLGFLFNFFLFIRESEDEEKRKSRSEDNFPKSFLSLHQASCRERTWVTRFAHSCLNLLSHFVSPRLSFTTAGIFAAHKHGVVSLDLTIPAVPTTFSPSDYDWDVL